MVGIKWLEDCISQKRLEDETPYLMVKTNSTIAVNNVDKGQKRTRDGMGKQEEIEGEEEDEEAEEPPAKKQKHEQKVKSKKLHIPVDEGCDLQGRSLCTFKFYQDSTLIASHHVFIDDDGTFFDAALNQTNLGKNANKFYRMQVCSKFNRYYSTFH